MNYCRVIPFVRPQVIAFRWGWALPLVLAVAVQLFPPNTAAGAIIAGPIANPATNHYYYLLDESGCDLPPGREPIVKLELGMSQRQRCFDR